MQELANKDTKTFYLIGCFVFVDFVHLSWENNKSDSYINIGDIYTHMCNKN